MKNSSFELLKTINVTPQEAWEVIGAVSGVDQWLAPITDCKVEGNKRYCSTENGSFEEDILNVDHEEFKLEYRIPEQHMIPVQNIEGQMKVTGDENGNANVVWKWDFEVEEDQESTAKEALRMTGEMGISGIESLIKKKQMA